jgi:hypothetical protein
VLLAVLIVLGFGFLGANIRLLLQFLRFVRLRRSAVLTWPATRPPYSLMFAVLAGALGLIILAKFTVQYRERQLDLRNVFGESMMLVYYAYAAPLSWRIRRGFYDAGIWSDSGFMRYTDIGGLAWREGDEVTLVLISRARPLARKLAVPGHLYGQARRVLHDRVAAHDIHFSGEGQGLDLGGHDERQDL